MIWHYMALYEWLNKFHSLKMAAVVINIRRLGLIYNWNMSQKST